MTAEVVVDDKLVSDAVEDLTTQTAIQNRYTFWYHKKGKATQSVNYEESMKKLASFQSIEYFWQIYNHMIRPSDLTTTTDYHLFKDGIKPTWEDPQNQNGGKWMVRLKKGLSSAMWEEIVLSVIGEQFDVGHEVCGAVVSVRQHEDIISVWNKTWDNTEATNKIRDHMRRIMKLPAFVAIEYKKHSDSMVDKSSYRNPTSSWKPKDPSSSSSNSNSRTNREREPRDNKDGTPHNNNHNSNNHNSNNHNRENRDHKDHKENGNHRETTKTNHKGEENNSGNNVGNSSNRGWTSTSQTTQPSRAAWGKREEKTNSTSTSTSSTSTNDWNKRTTTNPAPKEAKTSIADSENVWLKRSNPSTSNNTSGG